MPLYEITADAMTPLGAASFADLGLRERGDLQRYLAANIDAVDPDLMVICDEFGGWDDSRRRIDLLCIDREGRFVVVELKRDAHGGHMELQAIRYAAMVSTMTLSEAVAIHAKYAGLAAEAARARILDHLADPDAGDEGFGRDVAIILVAADFSKELIASVIWLNQRQLDIRCMRLRPFRFHDRVIVQAEQVVPLPEAEQYQFRVRAKDAERRQSVQRASGPGAWFVNVGEDKRACRSWDDCRRFGYLSAGGGRKWQADIGRPSPGEIVFAYVSGYGYVGCGRVIGTTVPHRDFTVESLGKRLVDLDLKRPPTPDQLADDATCEHCLPVEWLATKDREHAVRDDHRRGTCVRILDAVLAERLFRAFGLKPEADALDAGALSP